MEKDLRQIHDQLSDLSDSELFILVGIIVGCLMDDRHWSAQETFEAMTEAVRGAVYEEAPKEIVH